MNTRSAIAYATILAVLTSQFGCALDSPIVAWRDLLKDQPIRVQTHSGEEFNLQSWRILDHTDLTGLQDSTLIHIKLSNVKSVYLDDTPTERLAKTAIFVVGVVGVVATFVYFLWILRGPFPPGGKVG